VIAAEEMVTVKHPVLHLRAWYGMFQKRGESEHIEASMNARNRVQAGSFFGFSG
jgi:hypothetical protein